MRSAPAADSRREAAEQRPVALIHVSIEPKKTSLSPMSPLLFNHAATVASSHGGAQRRLFPN